MFVFIWLLSGWTFICGIGFLIFLVGFIGTGEFGGKVRVVLKIVVIVSYFFRVGFRGSRKI